MRGGQRPGIEPSLTRVTAKRLESTQTQGYDRRFFLPISLVPIRSNRVERASVDKQDHAESPCGQIG